MSCLSASLDAEPSTIPCFRSICQSYGINLKLQVPKRGKGDLGKGRRDNLMKIPPTVMEPLFSKYGVGSRGALAYVPGPVKVAPTLDPIGRAEEVVRRAQERAKDDPEAGAKGLELARRQLMVVQEIVNKKMKTKQDDDVPSPVKIAQEAVKKAEELVKKDPTFKDKLEKAQKQLKIVQEIVNKGTLDELEKMEQMLKTTTTVKEPVESVLKTRILSKQQPHSTNNVKTIGKPAKMKEDEYFRGHRGHRGWPIDIQQISQMSPRPPQTMKQNVHTTYPKTPTYNPQSNIQRPTMIMHTKKPSTEFTTYKDSTIKTQFKCDICKMDCTNGFALNKHLAIVHFNKELVRHFPKFFDSHENLCKQCTGPGKFESHPGVSAKLLHIGRVSFLCLFIVFVFRLKTWSFNAVARLMEVARGDEESRAGD